MSATDNAIEKLQALLSKLKVKPKKIKRPPPSAPPYEPEKILSPIQLALKEARVAGEDIGFGLQAYPVTERPDPQNPSQMVREYTPLPFKTLKELKTAVLNMVVLIHLPLQCLIR